MLLELLPKRKKHGERQKKELFDSFSLILNFENGKKNNFDT